MYKYTYLGVYIVYKEIEMTSEEMIANYIANGGKVTVCEDKLNGSDTKVMRTKTSTSVTPNKKGYTGSYKHMFSELKKELRALT